MTKHAKPHQLLLKLFRVIGLAEGTSFLVLVLIAMPAKYLLDQPLLVKYVGWAHGLLFVAYVATAFYTFMALNWKFIQFIKACIAAVVPFGPFVYDRIILSELND